VTSLLGQSDRKTPADAGTVTSARGLGGPTPGQGSVAHALGGEYSSPWFKGKTELVCLNSRAPHLETGQTSSGAMSPCPHWKRHAKLSRCCRLDISRTHSFRTGAALRDWHGLQTTCHYQSIDRDRSWQSGFVVCRGHQRGLPFGRGSKLRIQRGGTEPDRRRYRARKKCLQ